MQQWAPYLLPNELAAFLLVIAKPSGAGVWAGWGTWIWQPDSCCISWPWSLSSPFTVNWGHVAKQGRSYRATFLLLDISGWATKNLRTSSSAVCFESLNILSISSTCDQSQPKDADMDVLTVGLRMIQYTNYSKVFNGDQIPSAHHYGEFSH